MKEEKSDYLTGRFLLATPQIADPRFHRALIYVCGHDKKGAMGLVINRLMPNIDLDVLLGQLQIIPVESKINLPIYEGGPVDNTRGFVLHTDDYEQPSTVRIHGRVAMTSTLEILKSIAEGDGPKSVVIAMGYAGWGPKQLDIEMHDSSWLLIDGDDDLLFHTPPEQKWYKALGSLGIDVATLAEHMGQA